jgi:hypothetical protein
VAVAILVEARILANAGLDHLADVLGDLRGTLDRGPE